MHRHGPSSRQELTQHLTASGALKSERLIKAFEAVDRGDFVPASQQANAYLDRPLPIGNGQTISQPTTVAYMLEWLAPAPGQKILDIGSGSGWTTALLASAVGTQGTVIGVELQPQLVSFGRSNLSQYDFSQAEIQPARPGELGWPEKAPYARILVSAAAEALPEALVAQLAPAGRLVAPVKNSVYVVRKDEHGISADKHFGFAFVPLVEK